jgi:hypothetical protein
VRVGACRKGLEHPRTGNAALHDLPHHDLLMTVLCAAFGRRARDKQPGVHQSEEAVACWLFLAGPMASPAMKASVACPECSSRTSLASRSGGSRQRSLNNVEAPPLSSSERHRVARTVTPGENRTCSAANWGRPRRTSSPIIPAAVGYDS